jgi:hypothetical protein
MRLEALKEQLAKYISADGKPMSKKRKEVVVEHLAKFVAKLIDTEISDMRSSELMREMIGRNE